jgi:hypothetical protein
MALSLMGKTTRSEPGNRANKALLRLTILLPGEAVIPLLRREHVECLNARLHCASPPDVVLHLFSPALSAE